MKARKIPTSFGKIAAEWDKKIGNGERGFSKNTMKATFALLGPLKGKRVYDIACGNGLLARTLLKKGAQEVWASDVSEELIEIARNNYFSEGIQYSIREAADFRKITKNHFDAIVIHQGMFYIKDIDKLLKGVAKALKPNGKFIFTLLHPLFASARQDAVDEINALEVQRKYLKIRPEFISRRWDKKKISYLTYKRPISYYINACGRAGLLIEAVIEPKSIFQRDGKTSRSDIPASLIIKAVNAKSLINRNKF